MEKYFPLKRTMTNGIGIENRKSCNMYFVLYTITRANVRFSLPVAIHFICCQTNIVPCFSCNCGRNIYRNYFLKQKRFYWK